MGQHTDLSWAGLIDQGYTVQAKHPYFGWRVVGKRIIQRLNGRWPVRLAKGQVNPFDYGDEASPDMSWLGLIKLGFKVEVLNSYLGWMEVKTNNSLRFLRAYGQTIRLAKFQTGLDKRSSHYIMNALRKGAGHAGLLK